MNKIQMITGRGIFVGTPDMSQPDAKLASVTPPPNRTAASASAIDGRTEPLLNRLSSAGQKYRRSLFRR